MRVAILGFDVEGHASYEYFSSRGHEITICDQNTDISVPEGVASQLGEHYLDNLDQFDLLVRTPGMHPRQITEKNPDVASKITTATNEFFRVCPSFNIIGVTGTKGKGTTSTLITKILEKAGKRVHLGGNIGTPMLSLLPDIQPDDWVVLELSNFQLIDLQYSPHIALSLMIVPEHLNWHTDYTEYIEAKRHMFRHQNVTDVAIYFAENENSKTIASASGARKIPYFQAPGARVEDGSIVIDEREICRTDELRLLGKHNWQNACAAITVAWQITQDIAAMKEVLASFAGLPHRLELVRELDGVRYYDDSFGTTPETAMVAIKSFAEPKVVILGGSDKGVPYNELAQTVADSDVRVAVLIGETAPAIEAALKNVDFTAVVQGGTEMPDIVKAAQKHAQAGDVVLLSTGCASFDLFANYKDRGEQFNQAVQALDPAGQ